MIREYKTIAEVAGPLMLVKGVEDVGYDELGEIELPNGDIRHCRVLEINGMNVLVQLFENSASSCTKRASAIWSGRQNSAHSFSSILASSL